jgi:hypothetical protein
MGVARIRKSLCQGGNFPSSVSPQATVRFTRPIRTWRPIWMPKNRSFSFCPVRRRQGEQLVPIDTLRELSAGLTPEHLERVFGEQVAASMPSRDSDHVYLGSNDDY